MSSAGDRGDEQPGDGERTTVMTTPVGDVPPSDRAVKADDTDRATAGDTEYADPVAPPWQRPTSTVRDAIDTTSAHEQPGQAVEDEGFPTYDSDGFESPAERTTVLQAGEVGTAGWREQPLVTGSAAGSAYAGSAPEKQATGNPSGAESRQGAGRPAVNLGEQPSGGEPYGPAARRGPTPSALRRPGRGPRRASLQVKRFDPWSVLKLALVLSIVMFIVWMVAVGLLYGALDGMGVWDKLNGTYNELVSTGGQQGSGPLITLGKVFGVAAIVGAINVVLFTALVTIGSFVYNVSADLVGGLELTLAERE